MSATVNEHGHSIANAFLFGKGNDRSHDNARMTEAEMYEAIDLICDHLGITISRWNQQIVLDSN